MKGFTPDQITLSRDGRVDVAASQWVSRKAVSTYRAGSINGGCNNMSSCETTDNFNCGNWGTCTGSSNTGSCTGNQKPK